LYTVLTGRGFALAKNAVSAYGTPAISSRPPGT